MEKTVYEGPIQEPIYYPDPFLEFMQKFEGAERITWNSQHTSGTCEYFHISPENVTLRFVTRSEISCAGKANLTLYGEEEKISEIEKRILEGIQKISSLKSEMENRKVELKTLRF